MLTIDIHNEKGGVGCTTIARYLIHAAEAIGLRVAAMSLDPTKSLLRELEGTATPIIEPGAEPNDDFDLLIVDRNTQCRDTIPADVRVVPIRDRRSWETACDLSDRYTGPILWVPSMTDMALEIPEYLVGVVQVTAAIPISHAMAIAAWRRRVVWTDEGLARSAGARATWHAIYDILRRAVGPEIVLERVSAPFPVAPGASIILGHDPSPGFRVASIRAELRFADEDLVEGAELQLLHIKESGVEVIGSPWKHTTERARAPRDPLGHPLAIGVGEGLVVKITNTGRCPILGGRLLVDDDPALPLRYAIPATIPTHPPSAPAA